MKYVIDLDPTHLVLRVTMTSAATDPAWLEMYASLSHFAATGGPYALILDLSGDRVWWSHPGPKTMDCFTCSSC